MDLDAKKTALRMIPYGLFVITAQSDEGQIASGSVNWVTQSSFDPPQVVVCVRQDSKLHAVIEQSGTFALNAVGKGQEKMAVRFFKPAEVEGNSLGGYKFKSGSTGAPILTEAPAYLDCIVVGSLNLGDHSVIVAEVKDASAELEGDIRPDEAILMLNDLEGEIYYGG